LNGLINIFLDLYLRHKLLVALSL